MARRRCLRLDALERRETPAAITWDGGPAGTGTAWHDAVNWVGDVLPGALDDAVINTAGVAIALNGQAASVRSVTSVRPISMAGSTLTLAGATSQFSDLQFDATSVLSLASGAILNNSALTGTGSLTIAAGRTVELTGTTDVNIALTNLGTLVARGTPRIDGAFANPASGLTRVISGAAGASTLTIADGFTNAGIIELTSSGASAAATLRVDAGTLINDVGATFRSFNGAGGNRRLEATLDNRGTLNNTSFLTIDGTTGTLLNSGTITNGGAFLLTLADPFTLSGGSISGGRLTTQSITLGSSLTANFTSMQTTGNISGPGTLTVPAGAEVTIIDSTVSAPLILQGELIVQDSCVIQQPLTIPAGAVLRIETVQVNQSTFIRGDLNAVVTNSGLIELFSGTLGTLAGPITNAAGGSIVALQGILNQQSSIVGRLINDGSFTAQSAFRFVAHTSNQSVPAIANSGTIRAVVGDMTVARLVSTVAARVHNTGTIVLDPNTSLLLSDAPINFASNTLTGGAYQLRGPLMFPGADIHTLAASLTLDGALANIANSTNSTAGLGNLNAIASTGSLTVRNKSLTVPAALTNSGVTTIGVGGSLITSAGDYAQTGGATMVETGGTLNPSGSVTLSSGQLRGGGTVMSDTQINGGATIAPGASPGRLQINGAVAMSGSFDVELNGVAAGTEYDQLAVNGTVALGGTLNVTAGFVPADATEFILIDNDGTDGVTGAFSNAADGSTYVIGGVSYAVSYNRGTGNDVALTKFTPVAPPTVTGVVVNGGSIQRSRVTEIVVTFSTQVSFATTTPRGSLSLQRVGGLFIGDFTAVANVVGGVTVVTMNGFVGQETQSGSLADGRWILTAAGGRISANGLFLDGNGDGTGGDNFTFGDAQGLFRYFGDMTGDRRIDIADFGPFSTSYNRQAGDPLFNPALDFNNDGRIDIADFGQFSVRYFTTLP